MSMTVVATVLIIGASRGIGLETVKAALKAGHLVRALARSARRIPVDHPKLEKIAGRQSVVLAERPSVLDRHVLAFDVAVFGQSPAERSHQVRALIGHPRAQEPDYRHCRLLRARGERPRRRAADERDELAAFYHSI